MICRNLGLTLVLVMAPMAACAAPGEACDLAHVKSARELQDALGERSVEIVALAAQADSPSDARIALLVKPTASFSLGSGDVGRPLGAGVAGVHALTALMNADGYAFQGWDFMDMPTDGCAPQKVVVVFTDTVAKQRSEVEFSYVRGRLVAATGWEHSYTSGPLKRPRSDK